MMKSCLKKQKRVSWDRSIRGGMKNFNEVHASYPELSDQQLDSFRAEVYSEAELSFIEQGTQCPDCEKLTFTPNSLSLRTIIESEIKWLNGNCVHKWDKTYWLQNFPDWYHGHSEITFDIKEFWDRFALYQKHCKQAFTSLDELMKYNQEYFEFKGDRVVFIYDYFLFADLLRLDLKKPKDDPGRVFFLVIYSILIPKLQETYVKRLVQIISKWRTQEFLQEWGRICANELRDINQTILSQLLLDELIEEEQSAKKKKQKKKQKKETKEIKNVEDIPKDKLEILIAKINYNEADKKKEQDRIKQAWLQETKVFLDFMKLHQEQKQTQLMIRDPEKLNQMSFMPGPSIFDQFKDDLYYL